MYVDICEKSILGDKTHQKPTPTKESAKISKSRTTRVISNMDSNIKEIKRILSKLRLPRATEAEVGYEYRSRDVTHEEFIVESCELLGVPPTSLLRELLWMTRQR